MLRMAALLELEQVDAGYGQTPVLRGVSLQVEPGQAWVVLGPNGAGKSTLVRVVMGLLPPRAGRGRVGQVVLPASPGALARTVAWVPQVTDDDTGFTGLELALMGCAPRLSAWGLPSAADTALAHQALAELDVGHLAQRPLSEVSGGERRRAWLARALVQQPQLLVLDEPTAFLDVRHQVETLRAVRARVERGLAVLAVLHDVNLAAHVATHALLLKAGRVLAAGAVHDVLTAPRLSELYDIAMGAPGPTDGVFTPRWER
jgi:iron complex transport system ATP-binding protein